MYMTKNNQHNYLRCQLQPTCTGADLDFSKGEAQPDLSSLLMWGWLGYELSQYAKHTGMRSMPTLGGLGACPL